MHRFGEKNCKTNGSETSLLVPVANQEKTKEDSDVKGTNKIGTAAIKTLPPEDRAKKGAELDERTESREQGLALLKESAKGGLSTK